MLEDDSVGALALLDEVRDGCAEDTPIEEMPFQGEFSALSNCQRSSGACKSSRSLVLDERISEVSLFFGFRERSCEAGIWAPSLV